MGGASRTFTGCLLFFLHSRSSCNPAKAHSSASPLTPFGSQTSPVWGPGERSGVYRLVQQLPPGLIWTKWSQRERATERKAHRRESQTSRKRVCSEVSAFIASSYNLHPRRRCLCCFMGCSMGVATAGGWTLTLLTRVMIQPLSPQTQICPCDLDLRGNTCLICGCCRCLFTSAETPKISSEVLMKHLL